MQDKLYMGNIDAKRDWGHAKDYIEAMWKMLQHHTPDDYVIATGETYSVKEFLDIVFQYAGLDVNKYLQIDSRLFRPHEVPYLLGNPEKANQTLGWSATTKIKDLAAMMYESDLQKIIKENK
jgi:GDPmannose 4,6-dehydratase